MAFQDHFSKQASEYALHRPTYPIELFALLAEVCVEHRLAVDVGAGNGQAAVALADHFERVIAAEPSAEQIAQARPAERVQYIQAAAESLPVEDASADLIAAGQAAHWFDLDRFYAEVRRIGRPQARVALWCYGRSQVTPAIDPIVEEFYEGTVGPFWPDGRRLVEEGYRNLSFPFARIEARPVAILRDWSADQFVDYVSTWSAVARFRSAKGADPIPAFREELRRAWPNTQKVSWPISLLLGAVHTPA